jgi:hypothetical protein
METDQLMPADDFCTYYDVEYSFISSLQESGLIEITSIEERSFIHTNQLQDLEKFARLHYDMDINVEGIEAISHLLNQIKEMQHELHVLRHRLKRLE